MFVDIFLDFVRQDSLVKYSNQTIDNHLTKHQEIESLSNVRSYSPIKTTRFLRLMYAYIVQYKFDNYKKRRKRCRVWNRYCVQLTVREHSMEEEKICRRHWLAVWLVSREIAFESRDQCNQWERRTDVHPTEEMSGWFARNSFRSVEDVNEDKRHRDWRSWSNDEWLVVWIRCLSSTWLDVLRRFQLTIDRWDVFHRESECESSDKRISIGRIFTSSIWRIPLRYKSSVLICSSQELIWRRNSKISEIFSLKNKREDIFNRQKFIELRIEQIDTMTKNFWKKIDHMNIFLDEKIILSFDDDSFSFIRQESTIPMWWIRVSQHWHFSLLIMIEYNPDKHWSMF